MDGKRRILIVSFLEHGKAGRIQGTKVFDGLDVA
jgi:hypothetical protein